jgi:hypothetical protein
VLKIVHQGTPPRLVKIYAFWIKSKTEEGPTKQSGSLYESVRGATPIRPAELRRRKRGERLHMPSQGPRAVRRVRELMMREKSYDRASTECKKKGYRGLVAPGYIL